MVPIWSALWIFASAQAASAPPPVFTVAEAQGVPGWVTDQWRSNASSLLASFKWPDGAAAPDTVQLHGAWAETSSPAQSIDAYYDAAEIHVGLRGRGWREPSSSARKTIQQNLAHELAHAWQVTRFESRFEPRWVHEGFAEALSVVALERSGLWTAADVAAHRAAQTERCANAMTNGSLLASFNAEARDASYACGAILVETTAAAARLTIDGLFEVYADQMIAGRRLDQVVKEITPLGFLDQVSLFIGPDHSNRPTAQVIAAFRAGRL